MARQRREQAGDVSPDVLAGYGDVLSEISTTGRRLSQEELRRRYDLGARAAEQGVPMRELVEEYLSTTWRAWPSLPGVTGTSQPEELRRIGEAVFRAADEVVSAVTEGYEQTQRWTVRREESLRGEFIDDLLKGRNLGQLAERAERYGLQLAGTHVVAVASAPESFVDGGAAALAVQVAMSMRFSSRHVLVTAREGLLVCVIPDVLDDAPEEFVRQVAEALGRTSSWRVGLGQPHSGPGGAVRSFEQARNALDLAERLGLEDRLVRAADLLVYQVLSRDSAALAELVTAVLEPLRGTRSGPGHLLDTLSAYFAAGQVATAAARALHVGVRTVTYRLNRVRELTGYAVDDPAHAFTLQVAVLGAHLLGWPDGDVPR